MLGGPAWSPAFASAVGLYASSEDDTRSTTSGNSVDLLQDQADAVSLPSSIASVPWRALVQDTETADGTISGGRPELVGIKRAIQRNARKSRHPAGAPTVPANGPIHRIVEGRDTRIKITTGRSLKRKYVARRPSQTRCCLILILTRLWLPLLRRIAITETAGGLATRKALSPANHGAGSIRRETGLRRATTGSTDEIEVPRQPVRHVAVLKPVHPGRPGSAATRKEQPRIKTPSTKVLNTATTNTRMTQSEAVLDYTRAQRVSTASMAGTEVQSTDRKAHTSDAVIAAADAQMAVSLALASATGAIPCCDACVSPVQSQHQSLQN